jgi:CO/xanthine dehydrogenase FAD-binding subunit
VLHPPPGCRLLRVSTADAVQAILAERPHCRVVGGGTVLIPRIVAEGWTGTLVDLSGWPAANSLAAGQLGAGVSLAMLAEAGGTVPAHLADAAAHAGSGASRKIATVGGNCAPEVFGCVCLTLLSMASRATVVTAAGLCERPLQRRDTDTGAAALVKVRWDAVVGGAFARSDRSADDGRPACAVAISVPAGHSGTLQVAVGYLASRPIMMVVDGRDPAKAWGAVDTGRPADRQEFDDCLRRALRRLG